MAERPSTQTVSTFDDIWIGMPVVDVAGVLVGSVKYVRAGLPESAAEVHTQGAPSATPIRAAAGREPDVDARLAERFVHRGFLKVAGAGLLDHDCYVAADQIASADEDKVVLTTAATGLVMEKQRWI